ncbi:MAG: hypothetical protein JXB45_00350 [Candidatus Krumholzibacteriota bacterium]|nr:hypothetical protein [Candidatus Krumholzibacteriota bacterium]
MKKTIVPVILMLVAVCLAQALMPSPLCAEKYEKLYELFGDIKGWKAKDPEGMAMEMPGMKMIQATRTYSQGEQELSAVILIGNAAAAAGALASPGTASGEMKFESSESKAEAREIDGFMVHTLHDKKEKSGAVTVVLEMGEGQDQAVFMLSYEGLSDEEGLKLAQGFDWKKMKKMVKSLE